MEGWLFIQTLWCQLSSNVEQPVRDKTLKTTLHLATNMNFPIAELKLASSASDHNVFLIYVCTINENNPRNDRLHTDSKTNYNIFEHTAAQDLNEDDHIKVERSKALHELIDAHAREHVLITNTASNLEVPPEFANNPTTSNDIEGYDNEISYEANDNPNLLRLTKMKWLTEGRDDSPDSRSPSISLSPTSSNTSSQCSRADSETCVGSFDDKYLSTILRLDKEHNLFGLSNITIVGSRMSRKTCKKDDKPVFPQNAIVQVCCGCRCCRYRSNTDLPGALKCNPCKTSCCCLPQYTLCPTCPSFPPRCAARCGFCPKVCWTSCRPCRPPARNPRCSLDCTNYFGFTLTLKRKPKYEPTYAEVTPRAKCLQSKPEMCRTCKHCPPCAPPSCCTPYLMPCYWPARPSAPCTSPIRCFHNPPCLPPWKPRGKVTRCVAKEDKKCPHKLCKGNLNATIQPSTEKKRTSKS